MGSLNIKNREKSENKWTVEKMAFVIKERNDDTPI